VWRILAAVLTAFGSVCLWGATFFVDSRNGDDTLSGATPQAAWRTVDRVSRARLAPGDRVLFKRDCVFRGNLLVKAAGTAGDPITFGAYGEGAAPLLDGTLRVKHWKREGNNIWSASTPLSPIYRRGLWLDGDAALWRWKLSDLRREGEFTYSFSKGRLYLYCRDNPAERYNTVEPSFSVVVLTEGARWVTVQDLELTGARLAGVSVWNGSRDNLIRNLQIHNCGLGVVVAGRFTTVTKCLIYDLRMVRNTPGRDDSTRYDDFGAVGVWLMNSDNKVTHNTMVGLRAPSFDFGDDGGAVELFPYRNDLTVDRNLIAWNFARDCDGFLEVGGGPCRDTVVAYNIALDNGRFTLLHTKGAYRVEAERFYVQNNTVVETGRERTWAPVLFGGTGPGGGFVVRNNVFVLHNVKALANHDAFAHRRNIWYVPELDPSRYGLRLDPSEITVSPNFRGYPFDLHPAEGSPAIDAGEYTGRWLDYDGTAVPQGRAPDIGAYEYTESGTLFLRGDVNNDGKVTLSDALRLSAWLFSEAPTPGCADAADANDDGRLDLADLVTLLSYTTGLLPELPPPGGRPGTDPTADLLGCGPLR